MKKVKVTKIGQRPHIKVKRPEPMMGPNSDAGIAYRWYRYALEMESLAKARDLMINGRNRTIMELERYTMK